VIDSFLALVQDFFRFVYNVPELIRLGGWPADRDRVRRDRPDDRLLPAGRLAARHRRLFAARGDLDITWLNLSLIAAAILGDATGYWIGYRAGKALYNRPQSFFFRKDHLLKTHEFYERHGGKTIIIARFMPIVRTFAPVVAGAAYMTYRQFALTTSSAGRCGSSA
jgi:membrane-associated protein